MRSDRLALPCPDHPTRITLPAAPLLRVGHSGQHPTLCLVAGHVRLAI